LKQGSTANPQKSSI